jgi:acyl-CoA thioesterase II
MNDSPDTPESLVTDLITLLDVETLDRDLYRGHRKPDGVGRVFGGEVIAQALTSAQRSTDPDRIVHSLHAYFMRPGSEDHPTIYRVVRDHDGGSFSTRRIIAMQQGVPILNMAASFHKIQPGLDHQDSMPDVPPPEALATEAETRARFADQIPEKFRANFLRDRPIEYRPVDPRDWFGGEKCTPAIQHVWFRTAAPIGDDANIHRAILAYASDSYLLSTSTIPHGLNWMSPGFQSASLDHALWLHDDFRVDDWMLYSCDSPWTGRSRGFNRGAIYTRDGRLVASAAQEGLVRIRQEKKG